MSRGLRHPVPWLALALLTALAGARPALAGPSPTRAQLVEADRLYREANVFYAAEKYDKAIADYQAAYRISHAPGFLYNIAQSHRLAGHCREAIEFYEKYLAAAPRTPLRSRVTGFEGTMWRCIERRRHKAAQTQTQTQPAHPGAGQAATSPPSQVTRRPARRPSRWRWVAYGAAALGAGALAGGAYFGYQAHSAASATSKVVGEWTAADETREQNAIRDNRIAIALLSTGGVALVGGLVAAWLLHPASETSSITVMPTRGGVGVSWAGQL